MYIDSINSQNTDYAISSFQETLINSQANNEVKTIVFPNGYDLDSNLSFNIMFKYGHICSANDKPMTLNGKAIKVYSYSENTLINLPMITVSNQIWTLKANTSLELYYDETQFIVVGNPIVYTTDDCDYYANGKVEYKKSIVTTQNKVNQSYNVLLQGSQVGSSGHYNVNTACGNTLTFNSCTGVLTATTFSGALNGTASCATSANNATNFNNKDYATAYDDIRSGLVSMTDISTNVYPLALCTSDTTVGKSNGCPLTFNSTTGVLTATTFCGSLCGTASDALSASSANNATKFNDKDYSTVCNEIRDGLISMENTSCNTAVPIALCTSNSTVGISSCCEFTYVPTTGTLCVKCVNGVPISCVLNTIWSHRCHDCNVSVKNIFFSKYLNENYMETISFVSHNQYEASIKDCDLAYVLENRTCRLIPIIDKAYYSVNNWYSMSVSGYFEYKAVTYYEVCRSTSCGKYIHKFHTVDGCTYTIDNHTNNLIFSLSFV